MDIIYLASPRGICAGVRRAIRIVELVLQKHKPPIYMKHQIVHNSHVVAYFEKKGVRFIEHIEDVPSHSIVVLSAHGSAPAIYEQAHQRDLQVYDATCPLVTKVHIEAKRYEKEGYHILYIGKKKHQETIGVLGEVKKESITLVTTALDIENIQANSSKIVILSQTTLSMDETSLFIGLIKKKYPQAILPASIDICFSTQNRQNAVKELVNHTSLVLVIGSKESSNANRLVEVARQSGAQSYLINDETEIDRLWLTNRNTVGITAGASTPEHIIQQVINSIKEEHTQIKILNSISEKTVFPLPVQLTI